MAEKMKITLEGKQQLEAELHDLIHVVQPEVLEALAAARALGDLSENADYDAARQKQAEVNARIKEIQNNLANCEIIRKRLYLKLFLLVQQLQFLIYPQMKKVHIQLLVQLKAIHLKVKSQTVVH